MGRLAAIIATALASTPVAQDAGPGQAGPAFSSEKYGLECPIAEGWEVLVSERDDLIFVAKIPQQDPDRPAAVGCELGLAPESLDEYRTRIDGNAERGRVPGALVRNELVEVEGLGPRLVTVTEFRPPFGGTWRETTVRRVAHRQMYVFKVNANAEDPGYDATLVAFDTMVDGAHFSPPDTGAAPVEDATTNRWLQGEFKFAVDLPEDWAPALAPSQLALLFANGPAHGIWSDNFLVIARPAGRFDPDRLAADLPDLLRREEPGCEVLSCEVIDQPGAGRAVETLARTRRGPFSMTVLERRFRGDRFEYEVKFTLESDRFDELAPALRQCLDSFAEVPGDVPAARAGAAG
jgi:hypothetical protein